MTDDQEIQILHILESYGLLIKGLQQQVLTIANAVIQLSDAISIVKDKLETQEVVNNLLKPLDKDDGRG